jgi:hypothetical protein
LVSKMLTYHDQRPQGLIVLIHQYLINTFTNLVNLVLDQHTQIY